MAIIELDVGLAVEQDLDVRALELSPQRMPRIARDRRVDIFDRAAAAALRLARTL